MKNYVNKLLRLHEAIQEKLKPALYSSSEQIQILTLAPECNVQNILMFLNTLFELHIKSSFEKVGGILAKPTPETLHLVTKLAMKHFIW